MYREGMMKEKVPDGPKYFRECGTSTIDEGIRDNSGSDSVSKPTHIAFHQILEEISRLYAMKNADYAGDDPLSNLKECAVIGIKPWKGVLVRISDKYSRLRTFASKGELAVKTESIEDTFLDLATYSILGLILYREDHVEKTTEAGL
jgi:hypothetical protein